MKSYKISIGNPCNVGWQNMTAEDKASGGRHCAQCDKVVVDFTLMTDQEIIQYLLTHKKVCGHFNRWQVGRAMLLHEPKKKKIFHWPSIAAMVVAGMFQLIPSGAAAQVPLVSNEPAISIVYNQHMNKGPGARVYSGEDSLVTIRIKVMDIDTRTAIVNADVQLNSFGKKRTDKNGMIIFSVKSSAIPESITIKSSAKDYMAYQAVVSKADLVSQPYYELWMSNPQNRWIDGDISIDPN